MAIDGFKNVDGSYYGDIKIYTLSTCGWCKKTKTFLSDHGVAFSYIEIDLLPEKEKAAACKEHQKFNPRGTYPTIVLNGSETIVGYDPDFLAGLIRED